MERRAVRSAVLEKREESELLQYGPRLQEATIGRCYYMLWGVVAP